MGAQCDRILLNAIKQSEAEYQEVQSSRAVLNNRMGWLLASSLAALFMHDADKGREVATLWCLWYRQPHSHLPGNLTSTFQGWWMSRQRWKYSSKMGCGKETCTWLQLPVSEHRDGTYSRSLSVWQVHRSFQSQYNVCSTIYCYKLLYVIRFHSWQVPVTIYTPLQYKLLKWKHTIKGLFFPFYLWGEQ